MARRAGARVAVLAACLAAAAGAGSAGQASESCLVAAMRRRSVASSDHLLFQQGVSVASGSSQALGDAAIAAHIRRRLDTDSDAVADALASGVAALTQAMMYFTRSPPDAAGGIEVLAVDLLAAITKLLPHDVRESAQFAEFQVQWHHAFTIIPAMVQSIEDDLMEFEREGNIQKLVRSLNGVLLEVSATVTKMLPEQTGDLVARIIGGVLDVLDGIGDGLEALEEGDAFIAVEAIYRGVQAATDDLVPPDFQNDDTYKLVVASLDVTIGSLSKHVLAYRKHIMESSVCWRQFQERPRQRPQVCDAGYTWDGEQWCIYRGVAPYTLQSRTSGRFLNVRWGSRNDGANVIVWNNPDSWHTQWTMRRLVDGNFTIENVNAHTFLFADGKDMGANVAVTDYPLDSAKWRLKLLGVPGLYTLQSVISGLYLNLEGSSTWSGANVILWDNPDSKDCQWRIRSAWGGAPLEEVKDLTPALLETSLKSKRPTGALPAICGEKGGFTDKRGAWCYGDCPAGSVIAGVRCKTACGAAFPVDTELMCGKNPGALAVAVAEMVTETVRQALTVSGLVQKMADEGIAVAGGFVGTIQALIDAGKAFAHPMCPGAVASPARVQV